MKTLYHNAAVYTGSPTLAEAFLVEDGRFVRVGTDAEAALWEHDASADLGGQFVCPGFNDSHMHLLNYGQSLSIAPLYDHTQSLSDLVNCMQDHLKSNPPAPGQWLAGRGWNQDCFSDVRRMPTRWDLDTISAEIPIYVTRACGHAMVVNSRALELAGLIENQPTVEGGKIVLENGVPNGILLDNAMDFVYDRLPAPDKETVKQMLCAAVKALNAYGVTSCQSDDYCVFAGLPWQTVNEAYRELEAAGELTVRVYEQCNFSDLDSLRSFVEAGNITGVGTDFFRIGPLKMLGDGALGAHTAYLSAPYRDTPETRGIPVFSQKTLDEMIGYAVANGMQAAVHAIGDACLDRVISAMEKALAAHPKENHRLGIVHCQISRADQLRRLAAMKAHIYAQSIFLDYDIHIVEDRVGPELAATSYSWKTLKTLGCSVSNGTDCPVERPFALGGIQCAVTRQSLNADTAPYLPSEAFTLQEALDSYTSGSAYASFDEQKKGRIQPGMLADFTVLGRNPFAEDPHTIRDIPVNGVYLGGRPVYFTK